MAIVAGIQDCFNAGEFTPVAFGRVSFPKYKQGVSLMQRFIPMVQGGVTRSPGTIHVGATKVLAGAEGAVRLFPFKFSNGDAFVIEMGDAYIRFYRNRAPVYLAAVTITGISQASPAVVTYSGTDPSNGQEILIAGVVGMTQVNNLRYRVASVDTGAKTFAITDNFGTNINSSTFAAYTSGGTFQTVYEIVSPYALADINTIRAYQSFDVVYLVHPSYAPRKLSRSAITSWAFSTTVFSDGPYLPINNTTTTLTPSATAVGAGTTVTASALTGINGGQGFLATDVGSFIRIQHTVTSGSVTTVTWGWGVITSVTSTTVAVITTMSAFLATTASLEWRLGEFSDTNGYPSVVFSFEDRVSYGASPISPQTIDLSVTSDYDNFAPTNPSDSTVAADNALQFQLNNGVADPVRWASGDEKGLLVGTSGAEWVLRSSLTNEAMSAIAFPSAKTSTSHGSANLDCLYIGKSHLFVQTSGRKLREMTYSYMIDGFQTVDTTVLAEHATESGIARMAWQKEPFQLLWAQRNDGSLWAMTYDREQQVTGWHRHPLGGFFDAGKTLPPIVESIATIPAPDQSQDDLWISTQRYINGKLRHHIEYLSAMTTNYTSATQYYFVDNGISLTVTTPATYFLGFSHLKGETLSCLVDGSVHADVTVDSNGGITLSRVANSIVVAGYQFLSRLQTLRPDGGSADGTAQGKTKRLHKVFGQFYQTIGLMFGQTFSAMDRQIFRNAEDSSDDNLGSPVALFSGIKELTADFDYDRDAYICIEQDQPLPCTLLALMPQYHTEDAQ